MELADFYHRRIRPLDEIAALRTATSEKDDPLEPATEQRAWRAFERIASVIESDGLPATTAEPVFRSWVARYPKEPAAYQRLIDYLAGSGQFATAEKEIAAYGRTFQDALYPVRARADLEVQRGAPDAAISVYDKAFQPLWSDEMTKSYFGLLEQEGRLREFVGRARSALEANSTDLNATARLFHYFRSQNNHAGARRALLEYRLAKESRKLAWTADELETLARIVRALARCQRSRAPLLRLVQLSARRRPAHRKGTIRNRESPV